MSLDNSASILAAGRRELLHSLVANEFQTSYVATINDIVDWMRSNGEDPGVEWRSDLSRWVILENSKSEPGYDVLRDFDIKMQNLVGFVKLLSHKLRKLDKNNQWPGKVDVYLRKSGLNKGPLRG